MLTDQEATELGRAIDALIAERGLGAISKKDYELLVFHHMSRSLSDLAHNPLISLRVAFFVC